MGSFEVLTNAARIAREMDWMGRQVPYATALAMTMAATMARHDLVEDWRRRYVNRSKWPTKQIQVINAQKNDRHPHAILGSTWPAHRLHVEGGWRNPKPGSSFVGVPVEARNPESQMTTRKRWPGSLRKRKKFEEFQEQFGRGSIGMFEVIKKKNEQELKLWWVLKDRVRIKKSWPWQAIVEASFRRDYGLAFEAAWAAAQRTARR